MSIKFLEPRSLPEAVDLLALHGEDGKVIAGGTSVVLMLHQKLISPAVLISLGAVPDQDYIRSDAGGLHLGTLARLHGLERSDAVRLACPALAEAFRVVGNVRVRCQATLGGNLAAADYAADPPAMLMALDARVVTLGAGGSREIPISEFFLGFYTTALGPGEIITEIRVPALPERARSSYYKYTSISAEGWPCVAVGAVADLDEDGKCRELRLAVGAAVETRQRLGEVEALAKDQRLTDGLIDEIADGYAQNLDPLTDVRGSAWYRREMIRLFVKRALLEVRDGHR